MIERSLVLPHLLAVRASEQPDDVVLQEVTGASLTYAQLQADIRRWAGGIRSLGITEGHTVVTMMPNTLGAFAVWLGVSWLKAIEVPMNTAYRGHMLKYVVNDSLAEVLVIAERYLPQLAEVAGELEVLKTVVIVPEGEGSPFPELDLQVVPAAELLARAEPVDDLAGPEHYDIACMIYTSGTTGPSKGVLMPWQELYEFPGSLPEGALEQGRGLYIVLPVFHVSGKQAIWAAALHRARCVIRELFSLSEFWSDVKAYDCVATGLIGMMASLLYRAPEHPDERDSPLRNVTMGPLIPELDDFRRRFNVRVSSGYGMTEIGVPLATDGFNVTDWKSCGRPRPGYDCRIVDEHDQPLPAGVVGEFVVRTDEPWRLNAGYWRLPEKTAEAWRNGWFHTGDGLMYDEDGNFYFVDRIKDAIRRGGENISSFEVEGYVGEHESVMECAAIAVPSEFTEDEVKVVVVPKPDASLTAEELMEFLAPRMPRFMLPRYIEIAAALPKTPTLRVKKVELRNDALNERTWDREQSRFRVAKV